MSLQTGGGGCGGLTGVRPIPQLPHQVVLGFTSPAAPVAGSPRRVAGAAGEGSQQTRRPGKTLAAGCAALRAGELRPALAALGRLEGPEAAAVAKLVAAVRLDAAVEARAAAAGDDGHGWTAGDAALQDEALAAYEAAAVMAQPSAEQPPFRSDGPSLLKSGWPVTNIGHSCTCTVH